MLVLVVRVMVMVTVMAMVIARARVKERYCKPLTQDRSTRHRLMLCLACNIAYTTPTKCYVWRVTYLTHHRRMFVRLSPGRQGFVRF